MTDTEVTTEELPINQMVTLGKNIIGKDHHFVYVSGTEVECTKCPLGYGVTPETTIKDGHIYIEDELII